MVYLGRHTRFLGTFCCAVDIYPLLLAPAHLIAFRTFCIAKHNHEDL